ncbi:hypothetical protein AOLI_G00023880 [Acnodon oligacanthus]
MSLWMILPVSLPALTITGIWVVYAMALYNQHVCPVDNCKCGTLPPESCFFSLICSTGSFMVMVIVMLRYAHVIEKHQNCVLNTASLSTGWICSAGLIMVGNFQVDNAKHSLTVSLRLRANTTWATCASSLTLLAFVALVLSGVFFVQESFVLQHASAIFEWVFCVIIMLFYGTFAFEFAGISSNTMMVLARGGTESETEDRHAPATLSLSPCPLHQRHVHMYIRVRRKTLHQRKESPNRHRILHLLP